MGRGNVSHCFALELPSFLIFVDGFSASDTSDRKSANGDAEKRDIDHGVFIQISVNRRTGAHLQLNLDFSLLRALKIKIWFKIKPDFF